jgi:APA family basic amino acid/polyamine antiporter
MLNFLKQLFAKKELGDLLSEEEHGPRLNRVLTWVGLTSLGIGAIIGTGIFVMVGQVAHDTTGPALSLSFVVAGFACFLAALCYAEFAGMAPVAGGAYTCSYSSMGELLAWGIGWDLALECTVAGAAVAHGWSHYFQNLLAMFGLHFPKVLSDAPFDYNPATGAFVPTGAWFDLPAVLITIFITILLVRGIKESARFNTFMVCLKLAVVMFVIVVGAFYVNPDNWVPYAPHGYTGISFFGHTVFGESDAGGQPLGMLAGAAIVFFAYIGFDSVSIHTEEAQNPSRDVPIGIIISLVVCTILYIAVALVLTGMVPYNQLDVNSPVSDAFGKVGLPWAQFLIGLGALAGMASVLLVSMLSQPRILLAQARDGLLPEKPFAVIHPTYKTPWISTIITGVLVAILAAILPLRILADLVSIGTLSAFVAVCLAVLILRYVNPDAKRPFKVPFVHLTTLGGAAICLMLMFALPSENWWRLLIWQMIGVLVYLFYGYKHSKMRLKEKTKPDTQMAWMLGVWLLLGSLAVPFISGWIGIGALALGSVIYWGIMSKFRKAPEQS